MFVVVAVVVVSAPAVQSPLLPTGGIHSLIDDWHAHLTSAHCQLRSKLCHTQNSIDKPREAKQTYPYSISVKIVGL
jgi:hypothetical protein